MNDIVDTSYIQTVSVVEFAAALGFEFHHYKWNNQYWFSRTRGMEIVSMNTLIQLHNSMWFETGEDGYYSPERFMDMKISKYMLQRALASKIVETCKQQYSKKNKRLITQSHMVKFVDKDYYNLFIGE